MKTLIKMLVFNELLIVSFLLFELYDLLCIFKFYMYSFSRIFMCC